MEKEEVDKKIFEVEMADICPYLVKPINPQISRTNFKNKAHQIKLIKARIKRKS